MITFTSFPKKVFDGIENIAIRAFENKNFLGDKLHSIFIEKEKILKEKKDLEKELFLSKMQLFIIPNLKRENEIFKNLLELKEKENNEMIFANILSKPLKSIYNTFIIDKGKNDNIEIDDEVFVNEISIGKILEIFDNSAKIQLWTSNDLETYIILSPQNISLIAKGNGNNLEIHVPRDLEINEGDLVSNLNSKKIIGTIQKIIFNQQDSFQTALVNSLVNMSEVEILNIAV